ncbi:hypothetical protein HAX54_015785, partial [Datura stramonium]|nr:hypothetical protein [Datura stramonium]
MVMGRLPKSSILVGNWDNVNGIVNLLFPFTVYLPVEDLRFESNGGVDDDRKSEDETGERWPIDGELGKWGCRWRWTVDGEETWLMGDG